jgi:amino-acid N-acetyltransferase
MSTIIRFAESSDIESILALVNRFAAHNIMLPRTADSIGRTLGEWLVAVDEDMPGSPVVGCGALVALTETLVELRSLAVDESQHGRGVGSQMVLALVEMARIRGFSQICALTLREDFFIRLGFDLVDRWSISPKVWQECIYCPKFHNCDEVAVLMNLAEIDESTDNEPAEMDALSPVVQSGGWNALLKWSEWQPLRLAYQHKPTKTGSEVR